MSAISSMFDLGYIRVFDTIHAFNSFSLSKQHAVLEVNLSDDMKSVVKIFGLDKKQFITGLRDYLSVNLAWDINNPIKLWGCANQANYQWLNKDVIKTTTRSHQEIVTLNFEFGFNKGDAVTYESWARFRELTISLLNQFAVMPQIATFYDD